MKFFKFLAIIAITLFTATGCAVKDIPSVSFSNEEFPVAKAGGDFIIPVSSTGVDNVVVHYGYGNGWTLEENGDRIPNECIPLSLLVVLRAIVFFKQCPRIGYDTVIKF